jgi:hypothetical protein
MNARELVACTVRQDLAGMGGSLLRVLPYHNLLHFQTRQETLKEDPRAAGSFRGITNAAQTCSVARRRRLAQESKKGTAREAIPFF